MDPSIIDKLISALGAVALIASALLFVAHTYVHSQGVWEELRRMIVALS